MAGDPANGLPQQQLRAILAAWLRHAMAERGWNQVELARESGVERETINKIAQQRSTADDATIAKLATSLQAEPPRISADPFHLGAGDEEWFEAMAERYRRAAAGIAQASGKQIEAAEFPGTRTPRKEVKDRRANT